MQQGQHQQHLALHERVQHRVVHIEAGPHHLPKEALPEIIDEFTDKVLLFLGQKFFPKLVVFTCCTAGFRISSVFIFWRRGVRCGCRSATNLLSRPCR